MAASTIQINLHHSLPPISPYLSEIANKKVDRIALSCFEAIAHWFLTVFSCFYPAYERFYSALTEVRLASQSTTIETQEGQIENCTPAPASISLERTTDSTSDQDPEMVSAMLQPLNSSLVSTMTLEQVSTAEFSEAPKPASPEESTETLIEVTSESVQPATVAQIPVPESPAAEAFPLLTEVAAAPPQSDPAQEAKDLALVSFFSILPLGSHLLPVLNGNLATDAKIIRAWIIENPCIPESWNKTRILDTVTELSLTSKTLKICNEKRKSAGLTSFDSMPLPFPSEINGLKSVVRLSIDFNTFELPDDFDLPNLEKVELRGDFTLLPKSLIAHKKLQILTISESNITKLPDELNLEKLESLVLEHVKVTELPPSIYTHKTLRELSINYSAMTELQNYFKPPSLEKLSFLGTKISQLPATILPNLVSLKVHHDYCKTLPLEFEPSESFNWNSDQRMRTMRDKQLAQRITEGYSLYYN